MEKEKTILNIRILPVRRVFCEMKFFSKPFVSDTNKVGIYTKQLKIIQSFRCNRSASVEIFTFFFLPFV